MKAQVAVWRALTRFARNSRLLSLIDAAGLERLAACGVIEHREPREIIVRQGEEGGSRFYLIVAGEVVVHVDGKSTRREAARLQAGNFFGEIGTLTQQPRSATVIAHTPLELVAFEREGVLAVLQDYRAAREIIGSVGLARSEDNLMGEGLSESLEGEDTAVFALSDLGGEPDELLEKLEGPDPDARASSADSTE